MTLLENPGILDDERFRKKITEVKKTKENLMNVAEQYSKKYDKEIREGTKKKQLLISEGQSRGLSEEEALQNQGFIPSVYTPILNFLYFFVKEYESEEKEQLREQFNKEFGHLEHEEVNLETAPELETFIYGNMTHDTFKKIKKLKALSRSPNEKEAFLAYRKCLELCEKYHLEFDRIPCNIEDFQDEE
jgi:hypothetical protein